MTAVAELRIAADPAAWARIGVPSVDGVAVVGRVRLRFVEPPDVQPGVEGIVAWGLDGLPSDDAPVDIDGLSTYLADAPTGDTTNTLDVVSFDHVVVMTSSLERTCGAIEAATGEALKRVREAGPVRQGFHRLGPVIVEVVESDRVTATTSSFWGLVLNVADIHETCGALGPDVVSLPKTAVQPGRLIASFRADVGLGLPLAIMSPPSR